MIILLINRCINIPLPCGAHINISPSFEYEPQNTRDSNESATQQCLGRNLSHVTYHMTIHDH